MSLTSATKYDHPHKRLWHIQQDEEYIWSMRFHKNPDDKTDKVKSGSESASTISQEADKLGKQIKLFASFLPDEALLDIDDYTPREIECCLLYLNITGMHSLIERQRRMKADSKLKLTNQLNTFFGAIVQEILSNGGDVIKFSPSAVVAIWKCTQGNYTAQNVHVAIDSALVMRKNFGKFILETGVKLRVDFAITAGPIYFSLIGDKDFTKFILYGSVYEDAREARKSSSVNNIIVSPSAMQFIHSYEYILEPMDHEKYYQVVGLTKLWKQVRRNDYDDNSAHDIGMGFLNPSWITINTVNTDISKNERKEDFSIRPSVYEVIEHGEGFLKKVGKFFQQGIRNGLLSDEPIENMTEFRDVTVAIIMVATSIVKYKEKWKKTDEVLKTMQRFALKYKGYINYVTVLQNVTMFNVIFGLKGAAHVMQHRSALKFSLEVKNILRDFRKITTVTIGICTGSAYYTVIGHSIRQDLNLFGRTVLQAIALSLGYSDKIVCDQDTFIHSKMRTICFTLLKEKIEVDNLPDGLIYELIADDLDLSEEVPVYDQPAVGRVKEISLCENLYKIFLQNIETRKNLPDTINALYIRGFPKEGKSRLLHELIARAPRNLPVHFIPLHDGEENIPYYFIRRLFSILFHSNLNTSTLEDRQNDLRKRLGDLDRSNILWSINEVFNVNFPKPEKYFKVTEEKRLQITVKVLQNLSKKVLHVPWLIMVDDADYLDEHSWDVLEPLLHTKTFFLILTKNRDYALHGSGKSNFAESSCVKRMVLETICPDYIGGLICQHLRVFAIPADLENLLQKKSNGNIGFLKNLLTNLQQREFFSVTEFSYMEINKEHLVAPALKMLIRMTEEQKYNILISSANKGDSDNDESKRIIWFLFVESFENRKFHYLRENLYEIFLKSNKIKVCVLNKPLNFHSVPEELSPNIRITQLFETLTYPEQMILKSCSILGDTFPRKLLELVLPLDYYNCLLSAVKSFYEAGILYCGEGYFSDGELYTVSREKNIDPINDDVLTCKCKGIYISDRKLPNYAYCGLLRFRTPHFRENTYELLRETQKVDFHYKVIMFLNEETKRCSSCGRGSFSWDLNTKRLDYYEDQRRNKKEGKKSRNKDVEIDLLGITANQMFYDDVMTYRSSKASGSHLDLMSETSSRASDIPERICKQMFSKSRVGPLSISKLRTDMNLVRSFSNAEFTYCKCEEILSSYHRDMMVHCKGTGQMMEALKHMQQYAYLCISNMNISEAQNILKKGFLCISDIFESEKHPPKWRRKLLEAKLSIISAKAYRELGQHTDSLDQLKIAMDKYGLKASKNKIKYVLGLARAKLEKLLTFYAFPELHTKILNYSICEYYNDVAEALNMYAEFLMARGKLDSAELVSLKALYRALNAQTDFARICDCFATLLSVMILKRQWYMTMAVEVYALRYCYRKTTKVERSELSAVSRLYTTIFMGKMIRSEMDYSLHMGYIIVRLATSLNDMKTLLFVSSNLVSLLLAKLCLQEAASVLFEMEFCTENIDETAGQVWFHSQSLLFHIEIGYCIVPYQQCMSFLELRAIESMDLRRDEATRRLTVLMWIWCLRNEQWERATRFDEYIQFFLNNLSPISFRTVLSLVYILEGLLLLLVHKLNRSNMKEARKYHDITVSIIKLIEFESRFMEVHRAKLYSLKAYYYRVMNKEKQSQKWLDKTYVEAKKYGLTLLEQWTQYTKKAWNNELPKKKMDFWKDHCEENNLVFFQEFDIDTDDIGFFTLPTPLYV